MRVLLVDDEEIWRELGETFLERSDPSIHLETVESAEEALVLLKNQFFDAIVSDFQMDGMDGLEFLETLRAAGNRTPFLIFTGKGREEVAIKALNLGADRYLQKAGDHVAQYGMLAQAIRQAVEQVRTQNALITSEESMRVLINSSPKNCTLMDVRGTILFLNDRAAKELGGTVETLRGASFFEVLPSPMSERLRTQEILEICISTKEPIHLIQYHAGRIYELIVCPIVGSSGEVERVSLFSHDITERHQTENALRESQEQFALFAEHLPACVFMKDLEGKFVFVNKFMSDLLRNTKTDLIGATSSDIFPSEGAHRMMDSDKTVLRKGGRVSQETMLLRDGREVSLQMHKFAIPRQSGPMLIGGIALDVTQNVLAQEALRASEEKFRALFQNVDNSILLREFHEDGPSGCFIEANDAASRLSGYTRTELLQMSPKDLIAPSELHKLAELKKKLLTSTRENDETAVVIKDGTTKPVEIFSHRFTMDGKPVTLSVIHDLSSHKKHETALKAKRDRAQMYLDMAGSILLVLAKDHTISMINQKGTDILGWAEAELVGQDWCEMCLLDRRREPTRTIIDGLFAGKSEEFEYNENPILTKDGTEKLIAWRNTVIRDDSGDIVGILSSGMDITEKKQAINGLAESEYKYRTLFEEMMNGFALLEVVLNDDEEVTGLRILEMNPAFERLCGGSSERVVGMTTEDPRFTRLADRTQTFGNIAMGGDPAKIEGFFEATCRHYVGFAFSPRRGQCAVIAQDVTVEQIALRHLKIQLDLGMQLGQCTDIYEALDLILEAALMLDSIDAGGVYLVDAETGALNLIVHKGLSAEFVEATKCFAPGTRSAQLVSRGQPVFSTHEKVAATYDDPRKKEGLRALAVIPVNAAARVVAVLNLASHTEDDIPIQDQEALLSLSTQVRGVMIRLIGDSSEHA